MKNDELLQMCREIYLRHREAIDLIKATVDDDRNRIRDKGRAIVKEAIKKASGDVAYLCDSSNGGTNGKFPSFHSKRMDRLLPAQENATGSWGNSASYFYWFAEVWQNDTSSCLGYRLCLEFGGKGLSPDSVEICRMKKMYKAITGKEFVVTKPNGKKGVFHQTWDWAIATAQGFDVDSDEGARALSDWVQNAVAQAMEKEGILIDQCFGKSGLIV